MVVLVNSISMCCMAYYLAESTFSVLLPKFGDGAAGLGFDDERSHDLGISLSKIQRSGLFIRYDPEIGPGSSGFASHVIESKHGRLGPDPSPTELVSSRGAQARSSRYGRKSIDD
jgi:hypothetical protein